jgi:hypothetical protein
MNSQEAEFYFTPKFARQTSINKKKVTCFSSKNFKKKFIIKVFTI